MLCCDGALEAFSALQRAENSSIARNRVTESLFETLSVLFSEPKIPQCLLPPTRGRRGYLSVLFSEPKIPQSDYPRPRRAAFGGLSVLFSEPKIPQSKAGLSFDDVKQTFSALQRAENSSMFRSKSEPRWKRTFSALQRAENSSIWRSRRVLVVFDELSVLFSEPKIPQSSKCSG